MQLISLILTGSLLIQLAHGGSNGDDCFDNSNCDGFLECFEARCMCSAGSVFLDPDCYLLSGSGCAKPGNDIQECVPHAVCGNNLKCSCDFLNGFIPNIDLRCFLPYEASCKDFPNQCDPAVFLTCDLVTLTSKCSCQYPDNSYYSQEHRTCLLLAGSTCDAAQNTMRCTENAECLEGKCNCMADYEADGERQCSLPVLAHGSPCKPEPQDYCDKSKYLTCAESNLCECSSPDLSYYDVSTEMCYVRAEFPCMADAQPCVPNSICSFDEKCTCQDELGYVPNKFGICVVTYGSECSPSNDLCDELQFLECAESRCTCRNKNDTWFDSDSDSCRLLADAECSILPDSQQCIPKAICTRKPGEISSKCTCIASLVSNTHRQCFLPYNATCDTTEDYCDPSGFLHCNQMNSCSCDLGPDLVYLSSEQKCFVLPGGKCDLIPDGVPACVPNAYCDLSQECRCKPDYEDTEQNSCLLEYNATCSSDVDECNSYKHFCCRDNQCNCADGLLPILNIEGQIQCFADFEGGCSEDIPCLHGAYLKCELGSCVCLSPQDQAFDEDSEMCLSLLGRRCHLDALPGDSDSLLCGENVFCNRTENGVDREYGRCACSDGYVPDSSEHNCLLKSSAQVAVTSFTTVLLYIIAHV